MEINQFNPFKCLVCAEKIRSILEGKLPFPEVINLDLTNQCNYDCVWCYISDYIKSNRVCIPREVVFRLLEEFSEVGVRKLLLTGGGEPTLYPDFSLVVERAFEKNFDIGLSTNGSLLEGFCEFTCLQKLKYIRVSFDAGCSETYAKVHRTEVGMFLKVLRGCEIVNHRKPVTCQVGMSFLATPLNYLEIPMAVKLAEESGFDYIEVRPAVSKELLSREEIQRTMEFCNERSSINVFFKKDRFEEFSLNLRFPCRATSLVAVITADMKMNLCCQFRGNPVYQWGNLLQDSFVDLWMGEKHKSLIESVKFGACPICRMVSYNQIIEEVFVQDKMHLGFL